MVRPSHFLREKVNKILRGRIRACAAEETRYSNSSNFHFSTLAAESESWALFEAQYLAHKIMHLKNRDFHGLREDMIKIARYRYVVLASLAATEEDTNQAACYRCAAFEARHIAGQIEEIDL